MSAQLWWFETTMYQPSRRHGTSSASSMALSMRVTPNAGTIHRVQRIQPSSARNMPLPRTTLPPRGMASLSMPNA